MNNYKHFDLPPQKRINEIDAINKKMELYMKTINDFASWVNANSASIDIEKWYNIYEDFVKSNEHIIQKINEVMHVPP